MSGRRLCAAAEIPEGGGRGFRFGAGGAQSAVFVVRHEGALHAYVNSCPHAGTPLDWVPDRFFDRGRRHLLCGTHGALFRVADGLCVSGPCADRRLARAAIRVERGEILLAAEEDGIAM